MPVGETEKKREGPFRHKLGPFSFESEIHLPELRGEVGDALLSVRITLGAVPRSLPGVRPIFGDCFATASELLLPIHGVARFHVRAGSEVRIEMEPGVAEADVRVYLLGSVFGALCHQNGFLPLHASAVEAGGQVTAFLGESGAGKSTLAAWLGRRGYRVVSDDICLVERAAGGPRVIPVAGWLKLWRESWDALGEVPAEGDRIYSADDKFRFYLGRAGRGPAPFRNVVFLEPSEGTEEPILERVSAAVAVAGMMRLTYLDYLAEASGESATVFTFCAEVLGGARAYRLTAPRGWDAMDSVVELIEETLLRAKSEVVEMTSDGDAI